MSVRSKQAKFHYMLGMLLLKATELNTSIVILELYRDMATQKAYVARGVSKTLNSKHLSGLAVDIAFLEDIQDDGKINFAKEKYRSLGEFWESLGGRWGGRFGDDPDTKKIEGWDCLHFEFVK